jgi:hypothetical protein
MWKSKKINRLKRQFATFENFGYDDDLDINKAWETLERTLKL